MTCLLRSCTLLYFLAHTLFILFEHFLLEEYSRQYILLGRITAANFILETFRTAYYCDDDLLIGAMCYTITSLQEKKLSSGRNFHIFWICQACMKASSLDVKGILLYEKIFFTVYT